MDIFGFGGENGRYYMSEPILVGDPLWRGEEFAIMLELKLFLLVEKL